MPTSLQTNLCEELSFVRAYYIYNYEQALVDKISFTKLGELLYNFLIDQKTSFNDGIMRLS